MSYAYLFKYIIIGDTGNFSFLAVSSFFFFLSYDVDLCFNFPVEFFYFSDRALVRAGFMFSLGFDVVGLSLGMSE